MKIKKFDLEASYIRDRPPQNVSFLLPGDHGDSDDDSDDDDDEVAWISFCLRASSLLIDARSIIFPGNAFIATGYDANALWARIEKNTE